MKHDERRKLLAAMCLLVAACDSSSPGTAPSGVTAGVGAVPGGMPTAPVAPAAGTMSTAGTAATAGTPATAGATATAGTTAMAGTMATAGTMASAGTTGMTDVPDAMVPGGGTTGSDAGAAPGSSMPVPRIPDAPAECPTFAAGSMTIDGMRTSVDAGTPGATKGALLFGFHGTGGLGAATVPSSVVREITAEGGLIVRPRYRGSGETDIAPPTSTWFVSDMEWVDRVVACAVRDHNIDPNRIYATGCSAGGLMSGSLGLMRSEYMAAVAPNSGGINYQGSRMLSDPSRGPAAFSMHGGSADSVIINFAQSTTWFEEQNKMAASMPFMLNCNHGRGHCGAPSSLHEMAWEFMKAHPFNVVESPWKSSPPADLPDYCEVVQ